jgi:hypothetical protein
MTLLNIRKIWHVYNADGIFFPYPIGNRYSTVA